MAERRNVKVALASVAFTVLVALGVLIVWMGRDSGSAADADLAALSGATSDANIDLSPSGSSVGDETARDESQTWWEIDPESTNSMPTYKEVVKGRVAVELAKGLLFKREGDQLTIVIPQLGETYQPIIEKIDQLWTGDVSYRGTLMSDEHRSYRFTLTVGQRHTFAHLGTPFGSYELVAQGRYGWLMPSANMDQHVDYTLPDYHIPDAPRVRPLSERTIEDDPDDDSRDHDHNH